MKPTELKKYPVKIRDAVLKAEAHARSLEMELDDLRAKLAEAEADRDALINTVELQIMNGNDELDDMYWVSQGSNSWTLCRLRGGRDE